MGKIPLSRFFFSWLTKYLLILPIGLGFIGCTEEIDGFPGISSSIDNTKILVVEANLTNGQKIQRIALSQVSSLLGDSLPLYESNAMVKVLDDLGTIYDFEESENGIYSSNLPFDISTERKYSLEITTSNNERFSSVFESLPADSSIDGIMVENTTNANGTEGLAISVKASTLNSNNSAYRYNYEETYQIIAPFWTSVDFKLTDYDPCFLPIQYDLEIVPRTEEQQVCYKTDLSNEIILASGNTNGSNQRVLVRFIGKEDFIISNRYSILIKQFLDTEGAQNFYRELNAFNSKGLLFSQIQPGSLQSNITSENSSTKVIGYFSLSTVSEKRVFFNFEDYFPNDPKPKFVNNCPILTAPLEPFARCVVSNIPDTCPQPILERIDQNLISYYDGNPNDGLTQCEGPYLFVNKVCGDCTVLGSNVKPEFWVD